VANEKEILERVLEITRRLGSDELRREVAGALFDLVDEHPAIGDELADFEEALRALLEHDGRTVTAWAVVAGTQRLDPDVVRVDVSPLNHSLDYAVSSGTPPEHALGLADALASKLRRIARTSFVDEE
jgi:hypothetical protein